MTYRAATKLENLQDEMTSPKNMVFSAERSDPSKAPRQLRILIADDDRDSVLTLMMVLRLEGHETRGVYNGKQVIPTLRDFEADAIVLDIAMPGLSGWEVASIIKQRYGDNAPLLIGVSGQYKQASDKILSNIVGFNHYLLKPYEPSELLKLLAPLRHPPEVDPG